MTPNRFGSVLVVLDGTSSSWTALDAALAFCRGADAQLTVLSMEWRISPRAGLVLGSARVRSIRERHAATALEQAKVFASYADVPMIAHREVRASWKAVAEYAADHRNDLIVVGQTQSFIRSRRLGARADRLGRHSDCAVLLVP